MLPVARRVAGAVPGLSDFIAEEASAGHLDVDSIRAEALPKYTVENYNTAVRAARVLLAAVEAFGFTVTSSDAFRADCLAALRRPDRRLPTPPPESQTGEEQAETIALKFFAQGRTKTTPNSR
jgi:hypothetical protein